MTQLKEIAGDHVVRVPVPAQGTAGTDEFYTLLVADRAIEITGVSITWDAAITGAATNHCAFQAVNKGAAGAGTTGVTAIKAYDSGVDAAAGVPQTLTLATAEADRRLAAGDVLVLNRTTPGSGLASPHGLCEVKFRYR